jgi:hypothetical protein
MWPASSAVRARNVGCALPVAVSVALTIQSNGSMPARLRLQKACLAAFDELQR